MDITDVITMVSPVIEGTVDNYREMGADSDVSSCNGYLQALYDIKHLLTNEVDIDAYVRSQLQTFRESTEDAMKTRLQMEALEAEVMTEPMERKPITPVEFEPEE